MDLRLLGGAVFMAVVLMSVTGICSALDPCPCDEVTIPNCDFENENGAIPHWSTWQVLLRNEYYVVRDWWSNNPWAAGDQGWWNDASVTQTITIPSNAEKLQWYGGYWWHAADGYSQGPYSYNVEVSVVIDGQYLVDHQKPPVAGGLMEWDISAYRGRTVSLTFITEGDGEEWANWYTDWVDIIPHAPVEQPPVLGPIGEKTIDEDQLLDFTITASDPNGDTLTFSAEGTPGWASFDPATRRFSGTPGYDDAGSSTVLFTVSDGELSDSEEVTITVNNVNRAPVVDPVASQNGVEHGELTFTVSATDPDGDPISYSWDFDNDGIWEIADSASPTATHLFADDSEGLVVLGVGDGTAITRLDIPVSIANVAPTLGIAGAGSVAEGETYTLAMSSSDPGTDTITGWTIAWGDGTVQSVSGNPTSVTHVYADGSISCTISATATDEDGTFPAGNTVPVTVSNVAPALTISGAAEVNEGSPYTLSLASSDPGTDTVSAWLILWGDGNPVEVVDGTQPSAVHTYVDGPAGCTISATAVDDDGTYDVENSVVVTVRNVAPTIAISGASAVDEGSPYTLALGASDPGADTIATWEIDWGDGTAPETVSGVTSAGHTYSDGPHDFTISAKATDDDGVYTSNEIPVSVENVAPELSLSGASAIDEGSTYTLTLGASDPGADTIASWAITWGDGAVQQIDGNPTSVTHIYADGPADFTISATATDEDGTFVADTSVAIDVNNVAPSLGTITPATNPLKLGSVADVSVMFADPGDDTHTATWEWGCESQQSAGTVSENPKSIKGSFTYPVVGVYTVSLTLRDSDGAEVSGVYEYVVVYDPSGGFATGAGSIISPTGAYTVDPEATGRANFGFVSKYQKGATVPTGNTHFLFHASNMRFFSTDYQWLVVSGAKAQFKGSGTINDAGDFGFLVTATDGGTKGSDKFRIKIWDKATDIVVYDNQMGAVETADPSTVIENGNIVVGR